MPLNIFDCRLEIHPFLAGGTPRDSGNDGTWDGLDGSTAGVGCLRASLGPRKRIRALRRHH